MAGRPSEAEGPYPVTKVVDGDTVVVALGAAGAAATVRLIGIDTPETKDPRTTVQCFGREASARAAELLSGQQVWLEYDPSQDRRDRYGRTLAYLWTSTGQVNEQLVAEGFAHEYTYEVPYKYQAQFRRAQEQARAQARGLWSPTACDGDTKQAATASSGASAPPRRTTDPPTSPSPGDVYYSSCSAARAAGAAPLTRGETGYRAGLDGDSDGVACE